MDRNEKAIWKKLGDLSSGDFHGTTLNYSEYSDLFQLTGGFKCSPQYTRENIAGFPQLCDIKFEILAYYINQRGEAIS